MADSDELSIKIGVHAEGAPEAVKAVEGEVDALKGKLDEAAEASAKAGESIKGVGEGREGIAQTAEAAGGLKEPLVGAAEAAGGLKTALGEAGTAAAPALGEAGTAADGLKDKLGGLGQAGRAAGQETAAGLRDVPAAMSAVQTAEAALEIALRRLADPKLTPREMRTAVLSANAALNEYKRTATEAGTAVADMAAKVDRANAAIVGTTKREAEASDQLRRFGTQGRFAADGLDGLQGRLSSVNGVFGLMKDSTNTTAQGLGKVGLGATAAMAAIELMISLGKKLGEAVDAVSAKIDHASKVANDQAVSLAWVQVALREAEKGNIKYGDSIAEMNEHLAEYMTRQGKLNELTRAYIATVGQLKVPPTFAAIEKQATAATAAMGGALKRGGAAAAAFYDANKTALDATLAAYQVQGGRIADHMVAMTVAAETTAARIKEMGEVQRRSLDGAVQSTINASRAEKDLGNSIIDLGRVRAEETKTLDSEVREVERVKDRKLIALRAEGLAADEEWKARNRINAEETSALADIATKRAAADRTYEESFLKIEKASGKTVDALADAVAAAAKEDEFFKTAAESGGVVEFARKIPVLMAGTVTAIGTAADKAVRMVNDLGTGLGKTANLIDPTKYQALGTGLSTVATNAEKSAENIRKIGEAMEKMPDPKTSFLMDLFDVSQKTAGMLQQVYQGLALINSVK